MTKRRDLSSDDTAVWGYVARTVRAYPGRIAPPAPPRKLMLAQIAPEPKADGVISKPRLNREQKPAHNIANHRRVRRGALDIDGRIDLHGMTQDAAKAILKGFLERLRAENGRCALVITGKGRPDARIDDYYAPPPGVLRRNFPEWLNDVNLRPLIAGWSPAHAKHGGTGAFYVLLKKPISL